MRFATKWLRAESNREESKELEENQPNDGDDGDPGDDIGQNEPVPESAVLC